MKAKFEASHKAKIINVRTLHQSYGSDAGEAQARAAGQLLELAWVSAVLRMLSS
jgi:hypothetical protein